MGYAALYGYIRRGSQPANVEVKLRPDRPVNRCLASLAFGGTGSNEVDEWRFED